jgi:hypothetical protein
VSDRQRSDPQRYDALRQTTEQVDADRLSRANQKVEAIAARSAPPQQQSAEQTSAKPSLKEAAEAGGTSAVERDAYDKLRKERFDQERQKGYSPNEANNTLNKEEQGIAVPKPRESPSAGLSTQDQRTEAAVLRALEKAKTIEERQKTESKTQENEKDKQTIER